MYAYLEQVGTVVAYLVYAIRTLRSRDSYLAIVHRIKLR